MRTLIKILVFGIAAILHNSFASETTDSQVTIQKTSTKRSDIHYRRNGERNLSPSHRKKKTRQQRENRACFIKLSRKRPPRKCYSKEFSKLYDMVYTNTTETTTRVVPIGSKDDKKKNRLGFVKRIVSRDNLSGNELLIITDFINMKSEVSGDYKNMMEICDYVIDEQNIGTMIEVTQVFSSIGPRLLNNIEVSTQKALTKKTTREIDFKNIEVRGETLIKKNKTITQMPTKISNADKTNNSMKLLDIEGAYQLNEALLNIIQLKNIEKIMPLDFDDDVKIKIINESSLNSYIITGALMDSSTKELITSNIRVQITLQKLKHVQVNSKEIPVYWNATNSTHGIWSNKGCKTLENNRESIVFICNHLTSFSVLVTGDLNSLDGPHGEIVSHITTVGMIISILLEVFSLSIIIYISQYRLHHLSTKRLLLTHLLTSLIFAQVIFLAAVETANITKALCAIVALLLSYTYTCSFFWMLNIAIHLIHSTTTKCLTKKPPCLMFYILGYVVPALLNLIGLGMTKGHGYGNKQHCWLSGDALWIFIIPIAFVLLFNIATSGYVLWKLSQIRLIKTLRKIHKVRRLAKAVAVLTPSLGISWLFGLFLIINPSNVVLHYLFGITTSFQGLWIFICSIVLDDKIRTYMRSRISRISRMSTTRNCTSKSTCESPKH